MESSAHEIYVAHADLIERTIRSVSHRHQLYGADAEDFASTVRVHLLDNQCAVLRRFRGDSSQHTYLNVVITRQFQDWRNARWGKWRPSAEAKRLGHTAVKLETLTVRDGLSLDEAHELLRAHHGVLEDRGALESMAARFPVRPKRHFVDDSHADGAADAVRADDSVTRAEAASQWTQARQVMASAVRALPAQDRLILRMRFENAMGISEIARALRLEAKPLYRRLDKLLQTLRSALVASGLTAEAVSQIFDAQGYDEDLVRETASRVRLFPRTAQAPALTGGHRD